MELNKIYQGDCLDILRTFPDNSIDCCVTSPPYFALRDYGTATWIGGDSNCPHYRTNKISDKTATGHRRMQEMGNPVGDAIYKDTCPLCGAVRVDNQIGLEKTPVEYIKKLTSVFGEVYRVLKPNGTLWVNIGDTYNGNKNGNTETVKHKKVADNVEFKKEIWGGAKNKDLIGIPFMLALALRDCGWYLRQDIIWHKPNPMPESVTDRCTKSHEYIFLLSKSSSYFFDYQAIQEKSICVDDKRLNKGHIDYNGKRETFTGQQSFVSIAEKRNKRDVWSVNVKPFKEAHFATFPEELITPCILAGCPENGVVLDPFMGSGTTGVVASRYKRNFVGIELNQEYINIAEKRIKNLNQQLTLF